MVKVELEIPEANLSKEVRRQLVKAEKVQHPENKSTKEVIKEKTGYEVGEILAAPLKAPHAKGQHVMAGQVRSFVIGFALVLVGVIVWPIFGLSVALAELITGATLIAVGTFVRI